ncbi:MAG: hypothetical protein HFH60_07210 [Lachnospiraceae bacterium]|nr:hypothetical protein [Lachnospiraceae bacterium]
MIQYEEKIWDLEICKKVEMLKNADKIIIYGTEVKGKDVFFRLRDAGIEVDFFCDRDINKWGTYLENIEIISPFQLNNIKSLNGKFIYIIACIAVPEELKILLDYIKICNVRMITYWGIRVALYINAKNLYAEQSRRMALFQIENGMARNKFISIGMGYMYDIIDCPENVIWIVQPGKTASSSLQARLEQKGISCIKEHFLEYPNHIIGESFRGIWENAIKKREKSLKIIVSVREPLSRDYSAFWQAFTEGLERALLMPILDKDFQKMYNSFIDLILTGSKRVKEKLGLSMPYTWNEEFEWFDEQIKRYLDIDVFEYPFDRGKGYTIIKKEKIELLLFKVEKMEDILDEICSFVGVTELPSINRNVAKQKWYGLAYSQFRKDVRLPEAYVNHYYCGNSKMDFFYTEEEKEKFLDKWRENINVGNI